jgi:hypothetical protein
LSGIASVPHKHLFDRQQHDVESLSLVADECDEEVAGSASHGPMDEVLRLGCDSKGVGRLSGIVATDEGLTFGCP